MEGVKSLSLASTISTQTFGTFGSARLRTLCQALGFGAATEEIISTFQQIIAPWGKQPIGENPRWPSLLGDDQAPYEFSVAFSHNEPEVRVLLEAQGSQPTVQSSWEAALQLNELIASEYQVSLKRLNDIKDIFTPVDKNSQFVLWHAVCFWAHRRPKFKCYLNPQAQGASRATSIMKEALIRLGFADSWPILEACRQVRKTGEDIYAYFSLDLDDSAQARVKVYLQHYNATLENIKHIALLSGSNLIDDIDQMFHTVLNSQGPFTAKPITTCFSLSATNPTQPNLTCYIPIGSYAENDDIVLNRIENLMRNYHIDADQFRHTITEYSIRPLHEGPGMHQHISFQRRNNAPHITVYLCSEAYPIPERVLDSVI